MFKIYYEIWVDCILRIKSFNSDWWQYKSMLIMTFAMGIAFMVFMTVLETDILNFHFYQLTLDKYFIKPVADLLNMFFLFFFPFFFINYLLIFYNKKHEKIINQYKYHEGKYAIIFFLCCMLLPLLSFLFIVVR